MSLGSPPSQECCHQTALAFLLAIDYNSEIIDLNSELQFVTDRLLICTKESFNINKTIDRYF